MLFFAVGFDVLEGVVVVVEDDKHKQVLFLYYGGGRKSDVSMFICAQC